MLCIFFMKSLAKKFGVLSSIFTINFINFYELIFLVTNGQKTWVVSLRSWFKELRNSKLLFHCVFVLQKQQMDPHPHRKSSKMSKGFCFITNSSPIFQMALCKSQGRSRSVSVYLSTYLTYEASFE